MYNATLRDWHGSCLVLPYRTSGKILVMIKLIKVKAKKKPKLKHKFGATTASKDVSSIRSGTKQNNN
jgi:hypothetical protein